MKVKVMYKTGKSHKVPYVGYSKGRIQEMSLSEIMLRKLGIDCVESSDECDMF